MLTRMAPLLTRMARMLTRMTRWLAYYTHSQKGSGYYSNLVLFVYFQFLLESMSC